MLHGTPGGWRVNVFSPVNCQAILLRVNCFSNVLGHFFSVNLSTHYWLIEEKVNFRQGGNGLLL